jgi:hypothetical protein
VNSIFSPTLWLIFLQRIINVLYPVNLICLLFLAYLALEPFVAALAQRLVRKRIPAITDDSGAPARVDLLHRLRHAKGLSLILAILACDILARLIPFFAGIPFSHRYLYPFALFSSFFAALGLTALSDSLWLPLSRKFTTLSKNKLLFILLTIITIAYTGKSLMPKLDKKWIRDIPMTIRRKTPKGKQAVLFTNYLDARFSYYSGAKLYQCFPKENYIVLKSYYSKDKNNFNWKTSSRGLTSFKSLVREFGDKAFLLVRRKRKERNNVSTELSALMRTVATFTDDRRKWLFTLYQGIGGNNRETKINELNSQK